MITRTLSSCETDNRIGHRAISRKAQTHKKHHLACGDSCLHSKSRDGSSQTIRRSSSKRVRICNGHPTRNSSSFRNQRGRGKPCSTCKKKEQRQRWFKEAYPTNDGPALGCGCYLRNVHDKMADGKTACETHFE